MIGDKYIVVSISQWGEEIGDIYEECENDFTEDDCVALKGLTKTKPKISIDKNLKCACGGCSLRFAPLSPALKIMFEGEKNV